MVFDALITAPFDYKNLYLGLILMNMKLGKLEQITDLRSIWKNEATDFTPWLAKEENLTTLGDAIGIDIVLEETESNVGDFSVDLYASEEGTE